MHLHQWPGDLLHPLLAGSGRVADDDVSEPHEEDWQHGESVEVENDEGEAQHSEADGVDEEGEMSSDQVDVMLECLHISQLTHVDIEDVDHHGALEDVHHAEDQGPHGDAGQWDLILESVSDSIGANSLLPRYWQYSQHDEERGQDELEGRLNAARDAVGDPGEHLQPGRLHVVAPGAGEPEIPDVDEVADGWNEGVESEAEQDDQDELVPPLLVNYIRLKIMRKPA